MPAPEGRSASQSSKSIRQELAALMQTLYRQGMTTSSAGNLSARGDGDHHSDHYWVTPARIDKASVEEADIVEVNAHGQVVEGKHPPTSELPFHLAIYAARPDVRGIVHAHSFGLVTWSAMSESLDLRPLPQALARCGEVTVVPYAAPGSSDLAERIGDAFRSRDVNSAVLEHHGAVVVGATVRDAFERFEALEAAAQTMLLATQLGATTLRIEDIAPLESRALANGPPQPIKGHLDTAATLRNLWVRAYGHRLVTHAASTFSQRLDGQRMLVLCKDATGIIDADRLVAGTCDSPWWAAHQSIYRRDADVNCVISAAPAHATAHALANVPINTGSIPESYLVLREVPAIPLPQSVGEDTPVSMQQPAALIRGFGCLVAGRSAIDAFDRLEVLEATARVSFACRLLGKPGHMSNETLQTLREAMPEVYGAVDKTIRDGQA